MNEIIKQKIKDQLFTKTQKVNTSVIRRDWFKQSELNKDICTLIPWTINTSEQIYCILNDITSQPLCPGCDLPVRFYTYQDGYLSACNNGKCIRIANPDWKSPSATKFKNHKVEKETFYNLYQTNQYKELPEAQIRQFALERSDSANNQHINRKHIKNNVDELCGILNLTKDMVEINPEDLCWGERLYLLNNNLTAKPTCACCGIPLTFRNYAISYGTVCGKPSCVKYLAVPTRIHNKYVELCKEATKQQFEVLTPENEFISINKSDITLKCLKCGKTIIRWLASGKIYDIYCPGCYGEAGTSKEEQEVKDFINSLGIEFIPNTRDVIPPREIDIYIPSHNLAIEYNGVFWHSELTKPNPMYHLNKTIRCADKNIQLLHIWSSEWQSKQNIVKSIIKSKLGLYDERYYARKCKIRIVNNKDKCDFLDINHLQGNCISSVNIGLYYQNELIALMTFGTRQITRSTELKWELIRYATKLNTQVIGGASKLLKYFEKMNLCKSLITYADLRYSTGELYGYLGFTKTHISNPNYWYVVGGRLKHRVNFQKHKLRDILGESFDPNLTEHENTARAGYYRAYDCGNAVFEKILE